jgi:hypothetical protein
MFRIDVFFLFETDVKMIQEFNTLVYFKYIFLVVLGKGFWDRIVKEDETGTTRITPKTSH